MHGLDLSMRNAYHFTLYLCSPNFANVQSRQRCWLPDYEIFKDGTTEVEYTKQVLDRKIDWKQLADSKLINANDAGLLLDYDKQSEDDQANLLGEVSHSVPCASVLESRANGVWALSLCSEVPSTLRCSSRFWLRSPLPRRRSTCWRWWTSCYQVRIDTYARSSVSRARAPHMVSAGLYVLIGLYAASA